jgi:ABC transporter substrate binding protein
MRRREFIGLLGGAAAWPLAARAQQAGKIRTIGYLSPGPGPPASLITALFEALSELGWIEGKNVAFERRYAENRLERLPEFAAELVRLNVDVIVAIGTLGPLAAKRATSTIPIVMTAAGDPLGSGLVASLARPGGNVTGISLMVPDLGGKASKTLSLLVIESALQTSRLLTGCRRFMDLEKMRRPVALFRTGQISLIYFDVLPATSTRSLRGPSPPIFQFSNPRSSSWSSTSRPPRHLASKCRRRCSPAPTR